MLEDKLKNELTQTQKQNNPVAVNNRHLQGTADKICNVIVTVYFLIMTIFFPFYVKNGYHDIGKVKFLSFRDISITITLVIILVAITCFLLQRKRLSITIFYKNLSVTDWFMYGYFISVLISYIFTPYSKEALWGAEGWYMGLISQLLFISIYFMFSRYFTWNNKALYVILLSSGLVFLLGILNRYSIYPIDMNGQTPVFISTLGNINWFCGYWSVICPLGVVFYWNSKSIWQQAAAGIYVVIGFLIGVVQGSSSVYLVLAGIFVFLFCLSFRENQTMYKFLQICILFALSCQLARLFRHMPGFRINYENELGTVMTDSNVTLYIEVLFIILYILFQYLAEKKNYDISQRKRIRNISLVIMLSIIFIYIVLLVANTRLPNGVFGLSGVSFFTFDENWASHRGATWSVGIQAYLSMSPLYKLVGNGPDCFSEYIYSIPGLSEYVYSQFGSYRLTNAHNEWLTLLVNQGIIGLTFYVGIFVTAFIRFVKKAADAPSLYLCAASILLYTVHNMFSFQQVLNAPFVFIILGIGEGICRTYSK